MFFHNKSMFSNISMKVAVWVAFFFYKPITFMHSSTTIPSWGVFHNKNKASSFGLAYLRASFIFFRCRLGTFKNFVTNRASNFYVTPTPIICIFSYLKFSLINVCAFLRTHFSGFDIIIKKIFFTDKAFFYIPTVFTHRYNIAQEA